MKLCSYVVNLFFIKKDWEVNYLNPATTQFANTNRIAKFFMEDFDWGEIEEEKADQIKKILKVIKDQSYNHFLMINEIVQKVRSSEKDEF